ncbi:hypothetical protein K6T12_18345 [Marinobacterium sp. CAU 1594]|nr:hypothetical protein [Marinobacterium arenosum]
MGIVQPAWADPGPPSQRGIQPVEVQGNPTCSDLLGPIPMLQEFKINDPFTGQFSDGDLTVDITVHSNGQGPNFDWVSSGGEMISIFVKGGPRGNNYDYDGTGFTWDNFLHSPVNPNHGRFYGLSHISFCYIPGEPSIDVTKTCAEQTVNNQVVTTRNTVVLDNDGDFELTNIRIREDQAGASCTLTKVGGAAANTALPVGVWVSVPNGGSFDGNLIVGESVTLEVTCTGGALNLANKISGHGDWAQGSVMDMDSSNPAVECPFAPDPMVSIDKDCPDESDVRLMGMGGHLVVEVCPEIVVSNDSLTEPLSSVIVTDTQIPALSGGVQVGPLAPNTSVALGADLGIDLCYMPSMPEVAAFDDHGTSTDPSDDKYLPSHSGFLNTASVLAAGQFGGTDTDSDDTALRDSQGNILYLLDEFGQPVPDSEGNLIPLSECPLCAPCPDCPN